jgi:hypothetical protein
MPGRTGPPWRRRTSSWGSAPIRRSVAIPRALNPEQLLLRYVRLAHEHCFIANSVRSEIVIEPRVVFRDRPIDG